MRRFLGSSPPLSFLKLLILSSLSITALSAPFNLIVLPAGGSFQPIIGEPTTLEWTNPSNGTIIIYLTSLYSNTNVTDHIPASNLQATFTIPPSSLGWTYWFDIQNDEDLNQDSLSTSFNIAGSDTSVNTQISTTQSSPNSASTSAISQTSSTPPGRSPSRSLSTVAIIAIAGSSVSGVLLCLAAALLFRCVRKRNQNFKTFKSAPLSETSQSSQSIWPSQLNKG